MWWPDMGLSGQIQTHFINSNIDAMEYLQYSSRHLNPFKNGESLVRKISTMVSCFCFFILMSSEQQSLFMSPKKEIE